jgi:RHS repeat-associated protein
MTLITPQLALAQLAPTGMHYGGRATDTGYGASPANAMGTYSTSIPLVLPGERGGLPIPLEITYGTRGIGAAGLGWDIPFSYILGDRTFAHRRPAYRQDALPQPRERFFLSLLGGGGELVRDGDGWVLRSGTLEVAVRVKPPDTIHPADIVFLAYDGAGRTYTFTKPPEFRNAGLWLLESVSSADGAIVQLTYQITKRPIDGGTGLEVNLTRIGYNTRSPYNSCAKHDIVLTYDNRCNSSTSPLSISMLGEKALVRFRVLTRVDVMSRATCDSASERLRSYELQYVCDNDTKLPRLRSARMFGRQGTPEGTTSLPVASYEYGSATTNTHKGRILRYEPTQTIDLPPDVEGDKITGTALDASIATPGPGERYAMWQSLTDVTGDGRPDLVYKKNNKLWVALNGAAADGKTTLGAPFILFPLNDSTFKTGPFSAHTATKRRFWWGTASTNTNTVNVWRQAIDVNGDGRMDIIDAGAEPERWIVYLNTPGGPTGITWKRRSLSVLNLARELLSRGHKLPGGFVPLSRRTTGISVNTTSCLTNDGTKWVPFTGTCPTDNGPAICVAGELRNASPTPTPECIETDACAPPMGYEPEKTFIEWELTDLNGDGYPDFVFNSTPVDFVLAPGVEGVHCGPDGTGAVFIGETSSTFQLPATNQVRAAYNIVGVRFDTNEQNPFARSVSLQLDHDEYVDSAGIWRKPGVGLWVGADPDGKMQNQLAGFADVNGDGLLDRVVSKQAYLGVYIGTARAFSDIYLQLPSFLSEQHSEQKQQCDQRDMFDSRVTKGLRDLNGDGIPDYFEHREAAVDKVAIGTGAGFAPPIPVVGVGLGVVSHQRERCDGKVSNTDGGLFDINGDGKPDVIGLSGHRYVVSQLTPGANAHAADAGRLTVVDNGYGAITRIKYRSAKEDLYSAHRVPFPEIVATSIETIGTQNLGGSLAGTRYAYGNAQMIFDSARDAFVFPGYGRTVELSLYTGLENKLEGAATVVDYWPLTPFSPTLIEEERWLRTQRVGRVRDIYTLRGSSETDPWPLLHIDANDPRIIGNNHREWGAKLFQTIRSHTRDCLEMVDPFDLSYSSSMYIGLDACYAHGFAFAVSNESWYGGSPPPSENNVQARSQVLKVDDFGRVISARYDNDVFRTDDDVCIENEFAAPVNAFPRVLTALASRRVGNCTPPRLLFASESWAYDDLPAGAVSSGRLTSHTINRHDTFSGDVLRSVRMFDATYDADGTILTVHTQRDGAERTVRFTYDPFGLVATGARVDATGLPSMASSTTYDAVSLDLLDRVSVNGTHSGTEFDGFGRPLRTTVRALGGPLGLLSTVSYEGFSGTDPTGRRIVVKAFRDPVAPANAASTTGRTATVFLDELGRERRTEVSLGSDYGDDSLVLNARIYDAAGRVAFKADPYPRSQGSANPYGTSYHFKNSGDLDCIIRGWGQQPLNKITDVAKELFPTCFNRVFTNHVVTLDVQDAASLQPNSPQAGVASRVVSSAIGWTLERSTVKSGTRLEYASFAHDRLGQETSITRFHEPSTGTDPVQCSWRLDSTGQVLQLVEPESAIRYYTYSDWGEPIETRWMDGAIERRLFRKYDALGRLIGTEERNDGVTDPETVCTYSYDAGVNASPLVTPTFVLGQLARATSPSGQVAFSYDALGRMNAQVFTDNQGGLYVEKTDHHADGRLGSIQFNLPDRNYDKELVKYAYDSAGRLRAMNYADTSGVRELYSAESVDPFGRVRKALIGGNAVFHAVYADQGRRLVKEAAVESPLGSRRMIFENFDPIDRELSRREIKDGAATGPKTDVAYDALGRLRHAVKTDGATTIFDWVYDSDALGNLHLLRDLLGSAGATLSYGSGDRDRVCRIGYGQGGLGGTACNVVYDGVGNMIEQVTRTGLRKVKYFASGKVRSITEGAAQAKFRYDAFGAVQELDLTGVGVSDARHDRHYGGLIERRDVGIDGTKTFISRKIPGPGGIVASLRGTKQDWVFQFGELRGNRFFTNQDGAFVQDVDYQPFGEAKSTGTPADSPDYTSYQWNDGDALAAFGLSHLGARIYDPVIGRFLSRDPLLLTRTASSSSSYAFAANDPLNAADPTGLEEIEYQPWVPLLPWVPGGATGGGGRSSAAPPAPPVTAGPLQLPEQVIEMSAKIPHPELSQIFWAQRAGWLHLPSFEQYSKMVESQFALEASSGIAPLLGEWKLFYQYAWTWDEYRQYMESTPEDQRAMYEEKFRAFVGQKWTEYLSRVATEWGKSTGYMDSLARLGKGIGGVTAVAAGGFAIGTFVAPASVTGAGIGGGGAGPGIGGAGWGITKFGAREVLIVNIAQGSSQIRQLCLLLNDGALYEIASRMGLTGAVAQYEEMARRGITIVYGP